MSDHLARVAIGFFDDGLRDGGLGGRQQRGQPLAVNVHAVLDRVVLRKAK